MSHCPEINLDRLLKLQTPAVVFGRISSNFMVCGRRVMRPMSRPLTLWLWYLDDTMPMTSGFECHGEDIMEAIRSYPHHDVSQMAPALGLFMGCGTPHPIRHFKGANAWSQNHPPKHRENLPTFPHGMFVSNHLTLDDRRTSEDSETKRLWECFQHTSKMDQKRPTMISK